MLLAHFVATDSTKKSIDIHKPISHIGIVSLGSASNITTDINLFNIDVRHINSATSKQSVLIRDILCRDLVVASNYKAGTVDTTSDVANIELNDDGDAVKVNNDSYLRIEIEPSQALPADYEVKFYGIENNAIQDFANEFNKIYVPEGIISKNFGSGKNKYLYLRDISYIDEVTLNFHDRASANYVGDELEILNSLVDDLTRESTGDAYIDLTDVDNFTIQKKAANLNDSLAAYLISEIDLYPEEN